MKIHSEFICQQCGYKSSAFMGRCPNCGEWNSLVETDVSAQSKSQSVEVSKFEDQLFKLADVKSQLIKRTRTGFSEFDRVLGGGIVPGSIVLISGEPGIGKSTLLLQTAMRIAEVKVESQSRKSEQKTKNKQSFSTNKQSFSMNKGLATLHFDSTLEHSVLYVTAEESAQQVKIRADRIGKTPDPLYILSTTSVEAILAACAKVVPTLVIVDSIQTIFTDKLTGSAGSVGQVRECSQILQRFAKSSGVPIFIVGHVTKEGSIAGPKVLEHLVDAVCNLEGDGMHAFRMLRSLKNRFGSTFEVGVFEMQDSGMIEVDNPSKIFLAERIVNQPGSVVTSTIAGGRPLLAEVQALSTTTLFGIPTRKVSGIEFSRAQVVIASLSRSMQQSFANLDIYLNVAGGLKINEPSADLPTALAIASAVSNKSIKPRVCAFGEVGLLGELRNVNNEISRIKEAKRLGFSDIISPEKFKTLRQAIGYAIVG